MAITLNSYLEKCESISPASTGFSLSGGRAVWPVQVETPTLDDLQKAITQILGTINTSTVGDGRIQRTLPVAHPMFPWLYASNIASMRGYGTYTKTAAAAKLEAAPLPNFALYDNYEMMVEFTPRPYAVLADSSVPVTKNATYYDTGGNAVTAKFASEWFRYTDFQIHPQPEPITMVQGEMIFSTASTNAPNKLPLSSMQRKTIANSVVKFTWYQVPFRYVESAKSFLEKYQGYINQNDWYGWDKGSLLYLNYLPRRYTPPVPELSQWLAGSYSTEKWCDIEFTFLQTNRQGTDVPALSNKSWIGSGHNLLPWAKSLQNYYYVAQSATDLTPIWPSVPFELLFTDPDA